jgi:two-component system sensor histidine kinase AgrC
VRSSLVNFCENSAVNALLKYYSTVAESAGVNLKVSSVVPKDLGIAAEDLCVLIGNLLDNAVQAAAAVPEDLRVVDLDLEKEERGAFYLSMVNPYAGERTKINGQYRSQKKNGGIGLKSVMQITEKYHGQTRFRDADGVFYTSVMLEEVE